MRAVVLVVMWLGCARTDPDAATEGAAAWSQHIAGVSAVECAKVDSDGDGYCSCTVFRGAAEPVQLQCGCERFCLWNCVRGCKYVPSLKMEGR